MAEMSTCSVAVAVLKYDLHFLFIVSASERPGVVILVIYLIRKILCCCCYTKIRKERGKENESEIGRAHV